jgi:hypothetical protein
VPSRGNVALTAARRIDPATALFAVATAASGVLLVVWQSNLTFFFDDWDPLIDRPGLSADVLLRPHSDHILLGTTLVYKTIQATIGMESLTPYAVASTSTFLLSVVLVFIYIRRRVGEWFALAGVLPVLFLGAANEDLLWPFQIFFFGAMACGLGALLSIDSGYRHRDALACGLLVVSFTFSELALPFVLGVALAIAQERGPMRRAYVVVVPVLLYAAWYVGWGHEAKSYLTFDNVANSVPYMLDGLASGLASLLGLSSGGLPGWGRPLLVALLVVVGLRRRSPVPISRWFWVTAVVLLSFWFLTAANTVSFVTGGSIFDARPPTASRYQYIGAVLLLLAIADMAAGLVRPRPAAVGAALGVAVLALLGNLTPLHERYKNLRGVTPTLRGGLAGLEIEADNADPAFTMDRANSGFNWGGAVRAGPYLSAVDDFGSPAYSESELPGAPESARAAADRVMATALRLGLHPVARPAVPAGCTTVDRSGGTPPLLTLPAGAVVLTPTPGQPAQVHLRRFASQSFPVSLGALTEPAVLRVPVDRSGRPWQLQLDSAGPVTACRLSAT